VRHVGHLPGSSHSQCLQSVTNTLQYAPHKRRFMICVCYSNVLTCVALSPSFSVFVFAQQRHLQQHVSHSRRRPPARCNPMPAAAPLGVYTDTNDTNCRRRWMFLASRAELSVSVVVSNAKCVKLSHTIQCLNC
jgi:hypothetical protein